MCSPVLVPTSSEPSFCPAASIEIRQFHGTIGKFRGDVKLATTARHQAADPHVAPTSSISTHGLLDLQSPRQLLLAETECDTQLLERGVFHRNLHLARPAIFAPILLESPPMADVQSWDQSFLPELVLINITANHRRPRSCDHKTAIPVAADQQDSDPPRVKGVRRTYAAAV